MKKLPPPANSSPIKTLLVSASSWPRSIASILRRLNAFSLLVFAAGLMLAQPCTAAPFQWDFTGSLNVARYLHTATLLPNGMVLVAGGFQTGDVYSASAELYDPPSGSWSSTGSLNTARIGHTATLLSNGLAMVAGGSNFGVAVASVELYDPTSGIWSATGNLNVARHDHMATLLANGMVLVAGGLDSSNRRLKSAELYDPVTGTWSLTGSLSTSRYAIASASALLPNGTVLLAGGAGERSLPLASAEVYDPASGTWSLTGSLNTARGGHTTTPLPDGRVLIVAGGDSGDQLLASSELYDPASGTWSVTGSLATARADHSATLLSDGKVLVGGGFNIFSGGFLASVELYDPASGTWSATGSLKAARQNHTATLLPSGMVLAAAGRGIMDGITTALNSAELYDPGIVAATQASGRGSINGVGDQATFNFHATLSGDRPSGSLTFNDPAALVAISRAKVRTLTFTGTSATFGGTARLGDGSKVTYSVSVSDNSADGSSDTFTISLSNGYSAGGSITSGDIQVQ